MSIFTSVLAAELLKNFDNDDSYYSKITKILVKRNLILLLKKASNRQEKNYRTNTIKIRPIGDLSPSPNRATRTALT